MLEGNLPRETISANVLRGLLHVAEGAGIATDALLREERIELLESRDARVASATAERICLRLMERMADPALGLHCAERLSPSTFGPVSHLSAASPSLREGLAIVSQFSAFFSDRPFFALRESADFATIEVLGFAHHPLPVHRFAVELAVGSFVRIVRFVCPRAEFAAVNFAYPAPGYRAEYQRVLRHAVSFDQPFSGLVFDRALLSAPSRHRDDGLSATIAPLVQRRMAETLQQAAHARRVREQLEQRAPRRVTMAAVARDLGLSARSLRRRLLEEGFTYSQLESEVLGNAAARLLQEPDSSIKQVAHRMGFATSATFHRAFRRWTGDTPSSVQERVRGVR